MIRGIFRRRMETDPHECEEVRATFSDYLDDELEPAEAARLEAHVGFCPRCRQALTNLRVTLGGLSRLGHDEPDDHEVAERARQAWRQHLD